MLEVTQLSRRYGDFIAVCDVSFTIAQHGIVGLLGHNGAGKTTIMKMLSGFLEPDSGGIRFNTLDPTTQRLQAQRSIGYLPENLPVYPELVVADYLDYAATLKGLSSITKNSEIQRVVGATEIGAKLLAPIATLSRGYKQRVGVAQALLGKPALLILDEPTNGLDPTQTEHMRQLIRDYARDATVILSTHIMQEVDALCDRALILRNGELAVDAELTELRVSNELLLECSLTLADLRLCLGEIAALTDCTEESPLATTPEQHRFRLTLSSVDAQLAAMTAAQVAAAIAKAGGQLFALQPQTRNLETLFREVSDAAPTAVGEIHAA